MFLTASPTSKGKSSQYSINEHRVAVLIPALGRQPAVTWVINPVAGCHYFSPGLQLPSQPLRGLLPISLLGEQRHNGCEHFAQDCYPTASWLRIEPRPFCTRVQHANHSATETPIANVCSENLQRKGTMPQRAQQGIFMMHLCTQMNFNGIRYVKSFLFICNNTVTLSFQFLNYNSCSHLPSLLLSFPLL